MHAGRVAAYWYATAIVLVVSALLRLLSRPMVAPVWLPAAEIAAGVGVGALAWWIGRGARPARLAALVAGPVVVAGAVALYLMHIGYEFAAFPAALGSVVAASSAAAFVRVREPVAATAGGGWPGAYGAGHSPQYPPAPVQAEHVPQYMPQYRPHHTPLVNGPGYAQPGGQRPDPAAQPPPAQPPPAQPPPAQPPAAPRAPYQASREGAEQHSLQARPQRRPRHAAPHDQAQPSAPAGEQLTEPIRRDEPTGSSPPAPPPEDGKFTPDDHPDVELAPRRRRHAKPEPEDPGPASEPPATS